MANSSSDNVQKQVQRLFNLGTVGSLSDAQLLDWFVSERDEAREAAFEELMIRHGPMVYRVCRSVLQDTHDAEDAFQAAFLVLAHRARSIRRRESVASWLFGVAHRVASRARRRAACRRALDEQMALRTSEGYLPAEECHNWAVLHEEIDRLPERLRAPVTLCYLEGLTYEAAAHQLALSEGIVRGRLSRARERLRTRLLRRGVTVPAGLLAAGAAGQAQAAIPLNLIQSTVRIALGFMAGNTAAVLARGVLNSMLINQLKVVAILLVLGIGSSYWAWRAIGAASDEKGQAKSRQAPGKTPAPAPKAQPTPPAVTYRLTGSVRVEGTGEPVKGGRFAVLLGDVTGSSNPDRSRTVTSGADGRFLVDLPPGQAREWTFQAPVGYWAPGNRKSHETFVLSRSHPVHQKDYVVRRGTVWPFHLIGADGKPIKGGSVRASTANEIFLPEADEGGRVNLTLPTEGGKLMAAATREKLLSRSFDSIPIVVPLEWASGFRPEAVKTIDRVEGGYRLKDDAGRIATIGDSARAVPDGAGRSIAIGESGRVEPAIVDGKLMIRTIFSEAGRVASGSLSGRIVDEAGQPIDGVRVALAFHMREGNRGGGVFPDDKEHEVTTDRNGQFLIDAIPRLDVTEKPTSLSLVVRKEGFASVQSPVFSFQPGKGQSPHVLDPIRLEPGVSLSGTVVDPDGQPAEGVWIEPSGGFALRSEFTRTDAAGRFTVRNLPKGLVDLSFEYGSLWASGKYLADGGDDGLKIQLRPSAEMLAKPAAPATPEPPALGRLAPPLQVVGWTDGKSHSLADYRGKVVFLEFWGIWCSPCINGMPSLERLKQKYEPRGVVFLSIHTPGEEIGKIRRFLDLKKATVISALDQGQGVDDKSRNGTTADRYGVNGYPELVMIDRNGNLAFHSGIGTKEGVEAMKTLGKEMGLNESTMTEKDFYRLWEAFFSREIDRVLKRP
jgi:RNA polymerase sigma factor (sigma-70 family)